MDGARRMRESGRESERGGGGRERREKAGRGSEGETRGEKERGEGDTQLCLSL